MSTDQIPEVQKSNQLLSDGAQIPAPSAASSAAIQQPKMESDPSDVTAASSGDSPLANRHKSAKAASWSWLLVAMVTIGVVVAVSVYLLGNADSRDTGPKLTHTVTRGDLNVAVTEQGTLESSNNTEIKCRVRGYSTVTWIIESGSFVEPGYELVRLDTKRVEDAISLHTTDTHTARATLEQSKANLAQAEIAEAAYIEGEYKTQRQSYERELKIAQSNLESAKKMRAYSKSMFNRGYVSDLEVEGNEFTVTQARLELEVKQTQLDVLEKYTKQMRLETIRGNLAAAKSKLAADQSGFKMDDGRRVRAINELEHCVITADRPGMVIYPSAAAWKDTPDVTEGASVRRDQTLLLMPDLSAMQVKVGIHESMIDRVRIGMPANITMTDMSLSGAVKSVAAVARPAGWWSGNVVKYDVIIEIPQTEGLKPGMSAEVEVLLSEYSNVLTVPVAAVLETQREQLCWVKTADGYARRPLILGDGNDVFIVVEAGLEEGDQVVLNPRAFVDEAKSEMLSSIDEVQDASEVARQPPADSVPPVELSTQGANNGN